jgi:tetratricopeptide (TPR) repeat protein
MGAMFDPIRRQLLFDFERSNRLDRPSAISDVSPLRRSGNEGQRGIQDRFLAAVQAEESGEKQTAIQLYEEILGIDAEYAPAYINLGTIHFHLRQFARAEDLYRRATEVDPRYVLAFFDLGNVLDELQRQEESIVAYRRAIALAPRFADAHYNLALAFERKGKNRQSLPHWLAYLKLDNRGPWADHARGQIRKHLGQEQLSIARRATGYVPPGKGMAPLRLIGQSPQTVTEQR